MENKKVLFYGAGEHAAMIYRHAARKSAAYGEPTAFIDGDVFKQGHDLFGLPVISWEKAKKQYGNNFYIYVTGNEKAAPEILGFLQEQGVSKERIINWEPVEKRLGCWASGTLWGIAPIGSDITYTSCCPALSNFTFRNLTNRLNIDNEVANNPCFFKEAINEFFSRGEMEDSGGLCQDCLDYKVRYYFKNRKFHKIHFGGVGYCNFRCTYCLYNYKEFYPANTFQPYDIYKNILLQLEQDNYINDDTVISIATGEFSISEAGNHFVELASHYPSMLLTNAFILSSQAIHALEHSGIILCSVDAGTPMSFKRIKGIDGFEQVSKNLEEYSKYGPVSLKYILLDGINDTFEDLIGFFRLADSVATRVSLTRDYFSYDLFSSQALEFAARFIKYFRDQGKLNMNLTAFVRPGEESQLKLMLEAI